MAMTIIPLTTRVFSDSSSTSPLEETIGIGDRSINWSRLRLAERMRWACCDKSVVMDTSWRSGDPEYRLFPYIVGCVRNVCRRHYHRRRAIGFAMILRRGIATRLPVLLEKTSRRRLLLKRVNQVPPVPSSFR